VVIERGAISPSAPGIWLGLAKEIASVGQILKLPRWVEDNMIETLTF